MTKDPKHIVIDARIRRASTGRPIDRLLYYLPKLDTRNNYTILLEPNDPLTFSEPNFTTLPCAYPQFSLNPLQQITYAYMLHQLKPDLVFFTLTAQAPLFYFGKSLTFTHDLTMLRFARAGKLPEWLHVLRMMGYKLTFRKGNDSASRIIVPSNFVAQDLKAYQPSTKSKIIVIHEAGSEPLKLSAKKPTFAKLKQPFLLHAGSPFPHKNIDRLIEAFTQLKSDKPDLQLVLVGKKEYYFDQLQKSLETHPYRDDIFLPGFVSDAELKWLYNHAECYVLPSLSEGFGLPGLEAMANDCPLVSSDATCLPEIYGQAAEYFQPNDVSSMVEAIKTVITSDERKKELVSLGQKQVKQYSWEKMGQEINTVIQSLV